MLECVLGEVFLIKERASFILALERPQMRPTFFELVLCVFLAEGLLPRVGDLGGVLT